MSPESVRDDFFTASDDDSFLQSDLDTLTGSLSDLIDSGTGSYLAGTGSYLADTDPIFPTIDSYAIMTQGNPATPASGIPAVAKSVPNVTVGSGVVVGSFQQQPSASVLPSSKCGELF